MYIKELCISNYRGFSNPTTIQFKNGINVMVGANNAGKTTVIKALELLFSDNVSKKLSIEDFNQNLDIHELKSNAPKIIISAKLVESDDEEEYSEDLITVSTWLTKIDKPYEAQITYEFSLPEKEIEEYKLLLNKITSTDAQEYWKEIEVNFLRKYTSKIFVGNPEYRVVIDSESINKFDFQYLNAIRDVERDLFSGKNALLKEVIDFFMDYEIKTDLSIKKEDKQAQISIRKKEFSMKAYQLIEDLQSRMRVGKKEMLKYVEETGADFDNIKPSFDGRILDTELYSALKLVVENETGIKLPATRNGLGYNNLIYISLLLAKMQKNSSGEYMGNNVKIFPLLAIEEPEAHLHPNMQYKLLKFLNENSKHEVRQIFVTTHSPNITAAVDLDSVIVLYKDKKGTNIAYPGKVFLETEQDCASKKYVHRFLDVTKADMFFAKSIIFVEGIAEQLLLPDFAKDIGLDLTDKQISVINVNGRYFEHFLKLFDKKRSDYAIPKKIVCITDLDPVMKKRKANVEENEEENSWQACFPFLINFNNENYEYKNTSNPLTNKYQSREQDDLIRVYTQKEGSTFEYELLLENTKCFKVLTESVANKEEIQKMMNALKDNMSKDDLIRLANVLRKGNFKKQVEEYIKALPIEPTKAARHIIAARYLKSIKKGEVAQELSNVISENIEKKNSGIKEELEVAFEFNVPSYMKEAIVWICQ